MKWRVAQTQRALKDADHLDFEGRLPKPLATARIRRLAVSDSPLNIGISSVSQE